MTPAQLEHLRKIDAHLEKLLSQAEKRTPGRWVAGATIVGDGIRTTICSTEVMGHPWNENRDFITSCAGNAEAGWRATRNVIAGYYKAGICKEWQGYMTTAVEAILAAFPLELIEE